MEFTIKLDLTDRAHSVICALVSLMSNHAQAPESPKPQPVLAPVQQAPAPQLKSQPTVPTAPQMQNMTPVANPVPTSPAPAYTLDQLGNAGAALASAGKIQEAMALLQQFGIQSVQELPPEKYGAFATALRGLGAPI